MLGALLDATAFLTRVPVPERRTFDLARAAWSFPVVGGAVGAVVGAVAVASHLVLPALVAAILAVTAEVVLTGALHLDGLADCADGCGGRDRAARLRIMKDHAVGVYGALAVALALLLQVALVQGLLEELDGWQLVAVTGAAGALARAAMLIPALRLPYAREDGTGRQLVAGLRTGQVLVALALAVAGAAGVWVAVGLAPALALLVAGAVVPWLSGAWADRALGGVTGDVLGAVVVLTQLVGLVSALALLPYA